MRYFTFQYLLKRKITFFTIISLFVFSICNNSVIAQQHILSNGDTINFFDENNELLKERADMEYKFIQMQTVANEQRTYKMLFLALAGFIFLSSVLIVVLFYIKSNKIAELSEIQNREILIRDTKAEQLSLVLNTVNIPILIAAASGQIRWFNKAFSDIYKMDQSFLDTNNIVNFFTDVISENEKKMIFEAFETKKNISYKIAGDSENNDFMRQITILLNNENEVSGFAVTDNIL